MKNIFSSKIDKKNSLHISLTEFRNESRVLKEASSLVHNCVVDTVYIAALHAPGLSEDQDYGSHIHVHRFMLLTREYGKNLFIQIVTMDGGEVDFVLLGCPHYNLEQLRKVAGMLEGKKLASGTKLWVCTNRMTKQAAKWQGYVQVIEAAGGRVVCDSCPVESHMRTSTCQKYGLKTPYIEAMATESGKMARYVKDLIGCETVLVDRKECIKAAVTGKAGV